MKQLTITVDEVSAKIVADTLRYYNLVMLKQAEERDPLKDNSPYINAIEKCLEAYDKAVENPDD